VLPDELAGVPVGTKSPERLSGHQIPKCDLCEDRTAGNAEAVPRCVAACPAGALLFADEHQAEELGISILGGRTTGEHPFKRR
jgi:Fe-S-cluster-containing dehydrogenase component